MSAEVTGELEVFQFAKEDEKAPENSNNQVSVEVPEVKKKKTAKKTTEKIRWKKEHIVSKPLSADFQDKRAQARFIDPNLSHNAMWSIFEHLFANITRLLVVESNRYAHSEKNNPEFSVSMEEMMNFVGLVFMSGCNIRLFEKDYWRTDPDLLCAASSNTMSRN